MTTQCVEHEAIVGAQETRLDQHPVGQPVMLQMSQVLLDLRIIEWTVTAPGNHGQVMAEDVGMGVDTSDPGGMHWGQDVLPQSIVIRMADSIPTIDLFIYMNR
ncbi:hypothetical protein D9M71_399960 [compost metagenome]